MRRRSLICLISLLMICSSAVRAADLESLIYYTEEYPPFNFREDGEIKGIAVDLLREAVALSGVSIPKSNIILLPWSRSYRSALLQENSGLFSTTRTPHREDLFQWVGPIDVAKVSIIARKGSGIVINEPLDIGKYRIGVMRDDVGEQMLFSLGVPRESMQEASIVSRLIEQLYKKRIDLMVYDERSAAWLFEQAGYSRDSFETVYVMEQSAIYYAFNKDVDKSIIEELQKNINTLKNTNDANGINRYQAIFEQY